MKINVFFTTSSIQRTLHTADGSLPSPSRYPKCIHAASHQKQDCTHRSLPARSGRRNRQPPPIRPVLRSVFYPLRLLKNQKWKRARPRRKAHHASEPGQQGCTFRFYSRRLRSTRYGRLRPEHSRSVPAALETQITVVSMPDSLSSQAVRRDPCRSGRVSSA
jgi:hypothetical protein